MGLAVVTALFLVAMIFLGFRLMQPPDTVPVDAPLETFSSGRAMQHLRNIAAQPHPVGSAEHGAVRDYIVAELTRLGFQPEIQTAEVTRYRSPMYARFATVKNILIRIPGTENSKALLLVSHYDSVPNAPGATDDGSGVVTMLETLRALKHHPLLKNDFIFLFTDGEELGLLGAQAFVEQHSWVKDVGLALNFEGSGSGGQALMFETSDQNGWLIQEFAKAAPYPVANSLSYEIYKRMPNDTDLSVFKRAGVSGLNFAYIDGRPDYHTFNDNVANIDERSIQHHGSYALALTLHFGNLSLNQTKTANSVYFNTIGYGFIHYAETWVFPLMILAIVLYAAVTFLGFRAGRLRVMGIVKGLAAFVILGLTGPILVASLFQIMNKFFVDTDWWLLYYNNKTLLLGFAFLTVAVSTVLFVGFRDGVKTLHSAVYAISLLLLTFFGGLFDWQLAIAIIAAAALLNFLFKAGVDACNLAMGALFGWLVMTVALSLAIPSGSYLVTWPLILGLIPVGILFLTKQSEFRSFKTLALFSVFAVPGILWFIQWVYLVYLSMGINLSGIAMVGVALLLSLLIPHLDYLTASSRWLLAGATAALGIFFTLQVALGSNFNERFPKPNTLFYAYNGDSDETFWGSTDENLDDWTSQFLVDETEPFSEILPTSSLPMHKAPAPRIALAPPRVELLEDTTEGGIRTLRLRITSAQKAPYLNLFFHPQDNIVAGSVNGMPVNGFENMAQSASRNWWRWRYHGLPAEGIEVTLQTASQTPLEIKLLDISYGLPELADFTPRPANMIPRQYTLSNMTVVTKTFRFE